MPSRNGIPVPREQRNAAAQGRRPSVRDVGQAPWRSSLDLVWSYSRSQAFYGQNIATSPSFADRHWAGPSHAIDSSVDEEGTEDEDEEILTEDASTQDDDEEYDDDEDRDLTASPAAPMEWPDEQLPANAYQRRDSDRRRGSATLGRRERRMENTPASNHRRVKDRRLSRIAMDDDPDEERSRSRSRSPKRLNPTRAISSLRPSSKASGESSQDLEDSAKGQKKSTSTHNAADENTSLLSPSATEAAQPAPQTLRTPSWFQSSKASSSAGPKFRLQGYGTSTFWQSWFNTVNALVGVGILALPLAIAYAGLIPGILLFLLCGLVTNYTGKVLAHIMATNPALRTYADIGNFAFGPKARLIVGFFFCFELWAVSTALIILFGDSAKALAVSSVEKEGAEGVIGTIAEWPPAAFKALGVVIVLPTMFLPLKLLSPISVVGIISIATLFFVVFSDGLIKKHSPGSLWEPANFSLGPQWSRLPLSFGLIMSGFSTHPIVPSLFKDMKNPAEFCKMLNWAYLAATAIYLSMGITGYIMFGNSVSDEITRDLAHTKGYPPVLNKIAIWLIIINPLSKFALAARPITSTLELMLGVEQSQVKDRPSLRATRSGRLKYGSSGEGDGCKAAMLQPPLSSEAGPGTTPGRVQAREGAREEEEGFEGPSSPYTAGSTSTFTLQGMTSEVRPQQSPLAGSAISIRAAQRTAGWSKQKKLFTRFILQTIITFLIGGTAIALPGFEQTMAFLGAFLACITCIFGPLLANLRLLHHEMSRFNIFMDVLILIVFAAIAAIGTVWSFLPHARVAGL